LGFFRLLKLKIGPQAFQIWALITGLFVKIYILKRPTKNFRPFRPVGQKFEAHQALPNIKALLARAWGPI
jgi:hypothetical protein